MRKLLWASVFGGALLVSGVVSAHPDHDDDYESDSPEVTRTFDYSDFHALRISGVYELDVIVGESYSIELTGPEDEMDLVEVVQDDGVLSLGNKRKWKGKNREGIDARITMPALDDVRVSGVANGDITGVEADDFELDVSGVAEVTIDGTCKSLDAHVSGVGELDAEDFRCDNVEVDLTGVGEVSVYASEYADISASGVGEVDVYGSPKKVDKNKSLFTDINIY